MNRLNQIGRLGKLSSYKAGGSWGSYWASPNVTEFYAETANIADGKLYNQIKGKTDYLTVAGTTGAETYTIPDNATYKAADTDLFWANANGLVYTVTTAELIAYDLPRTIVKYAATSPYAIESILILKAGVVLTQAQIDILHTDFALSQFWSGVLNENGVIKGNRGAAQNAYTAPTEAACDYGDTYQTAVLADSGEIISRRRVDLEYQRLINTGDIDSCWYSYHFECGVKKSSVDYGGVVGTKDVVLKWYNLSPVAGRFAQSVAAYVDATYDTRPEYTDSGLLFRPTNLNGTTRCGLMSAASVLTNNNGIVRCVGSVTPVAFTANAFQIKGYISDDGLILISDTITTRKLTVIARSTGGGSSYARTTTPAVFANGVEVGYEVTANFNVGGTVAVKINGSTVAMDANTFGPPYPAHNYADCIGTGRDIGRLPWNGYIKQIELFTL